MTSSEWKTLQELLDRLSPDERLMLIERLARSMHSDQTNPAEMQLAALKRLRDELAALPVTNPDDGFSNREHDRLLYGEGQ